MAIPEDDEKTRIHRPGAQPPPLPEDDDTNVTDRRNRPSADAEASADDESGMTRLVGPPRRLPKSEEPRANEGGGESDPVVAWLVVMSGPGRGNSVRLGYGQNSVGRDRDERVSIDFGDASISRKKHCFIIYEPRKREYVLRPGDSANLAYLNGELVSEARPLVAGNLIELGKTTLRFVPFCGPDFDWQEQAGA